MAHSRGRIDPATREALQLLGKVLRDLRLERGMTQRALASRCGLSQPTISRLECGLAEGARAATIARLLAGLDRSVQALPDDRPVLERCHGFRRLRRAFSREAGDARAWSRELERRERLRAYARAVGASTDGL